MISPYRAGLFVCLVLLFFVLGSCSKQGGGQGTADDGKALQRATASKKTSELATSSHRSQSKSKGAIVKKVCPRLTKKQFKELNKLFFHMNSEVTVEQVRTNTCAYSQIVDAGYRLFQSESLADYIVAGVDRDFFESSDDLREVFNNFKELVGSEYQTGCARYDIHEFPYIQGVQLLKKLKRYSRYQVSCPQS